MNFDFFYRKWTELMEIFRYLAYLKYDFTTVELTGLQETYIYITGECTGL